MSESEFRDVLDGGGYPAVAPALILSAHPILASLYAAIAGLEHVGLDREDWSAAMDARGETDRWCSLCPAGECPARMHIVLGPSDLIGVARWLDLCHACYSRLRDLASWGYDDGDLISAYELWSRSW